MGYVINGCFDHDSFRKRVKSELKKRGLKYKDLAIKCGYTQGSIGLYMCGQNDSKFIPPAIASSLEISLEDEDAK